MAGSSIPFENLVVGRKYMITVHIGRTENGLGTLTRKSRYPDRKDDQIQIILDRKPATRINGPYNFFEFRSATFPTLRSLAAAEVKNQVRLNNLELDDAAIAALENEERASRMGGRKRRRKTRKQKKRSRKTRRR
jgi:hypothetical protein